MKIIIIDDNNEFRENLSFFVSQKLGHKISGSYSSGLSFIQKLADHKPDIILMDISMPELDGYEIMKMLNWHNSDLKVIAVTMFTDKAYLHKLIEVGFKGCVFKSRIFTELKDAIDLVSEGCYYWPQSISTVE